MINDKKGGVRFRSTSGCFSTALLHAATTIDHTHLKGEQSSNTARCSPFVPNGCMAAKSAEDGSSASKFADISKRVARHLSPAQLLKVKEHVLVPNDPILSLNGFPASPTVRFYSETSMTWPLGAFRWFISSKPSTFHSLTMWAKLYKPHNNYQDDAVSQHDASLARLLARPCGRSRQQHASRICASTCGDSSISNAHGPSLVPRSSSDGP